MKKMKILLLFLGVITAFSGCVAETTSVTALETASAETVETETAAAETTESERDNPAPKGNLYLKVSSITFSLVGEHEDIYLGMIPKEWITWWSEDPSIVNVTDGVLTAVGVGSTTIHASVEDRQVSCVASCLARTQQELDSLDADVLSAPKRLPPEIDLEEPCDYFDDSAIVGDSITYFLWQYENEKHYLGNMTFISRHGVSIHCLVNRSKNMYFEGHEMNIEDIIAQVDASRIYILLGCLDFQVPASTLTLMEHWEQMLDLIIEKAPDKEIIIVSNIPSYTTKAELTPFNAEVAKVTPQLRKLAVEKGCGFLDLGYYIQDHYGRMPQIYCQDEFHMNGEGSLVWIKLLRFFAKYEREGGSLA